MRVFFLRHGPKNSETWRLTENGIIASEEYGEKFAPSASGDKYILKAYTSEIDRTQETAEAIIKKVNTDRKGRTRVKLELGEKDEDIKISTDALSLPYSEYIKQSRWEEKNGKKTISLHKLAQRIAKQVEYFIGMSKRFKSDSRADLINIAHFPWLGAFIKESIGQELEKEENQNKKNKIENKITNLGYLDGFEIVIKRDGDSVKLTFKIGDDELALSEESIKKILDS